MNQQTKIQSSKKKEFLGLSLFGLLCFFTPAFAEKKQGLVDGAQMEAQYQKSLVDRFIVFTQDKNVMGKSESPDGKPQEGGQKTRFNGDDGLAYQSDLTYHDFSFNTNDEQAKAANQNDKPGPTRTLYAFVSEHGGIAAGGGSSLLERTIYQLHQKYSQEEEQDPEAKKQREEQTGKKFKSVFEVETKQVFQEGGGGGGAGGGGEGNKEPDKVERTKMREDVNKATVDVGLQSVDTIEKSAKGPESAEDGSVMGNVTFYLKAAAKASKALWDSTLANLGQRRVNRAIKTGGALIRPTLSEGMPNCAAWGQSAQQELQKIEDPQTRQQQEQEIQEMIQKCEQMAGTQYSMIDPQFQEDEGGGGGGGGGGPGGKSTGGIEEKGPQKEDDKARDLRIEMTLLDKYGSSVKDTKSNWQYEEKDEKALVNMGTDDSGNPLEPVEMTVKEQMEERNRLLDQTKQNWNQVKQVAPDVFGQFDENSLDQYKLEPGKANILQTNVVPDHILDETGTKGSPAPEAAKSYKELVQQTGGK